jgi:DoxX-like family
MLASKACGTLRARNAVTVALSSIRTTWIASPKARTGSAPTGGGERPSSRSGRLDTATLVRGLGILGLVCTALYAVPRTSLLGAILLTGYLGGTVATHLRVGSPIFSHMLFGVYLGIMLWGGLYLRDDRVRNLIPFRRS